MGSLRTGLPDEPRMPPTPRGDVCLPHTRSAGYSNFGREGTGLRREGTGRTPSATTAGGLQAPAQISLRVQVPDAPQRRYEMIRPMPIDIALAKRHGSPRKRSVEPGSKGSPRAPGPAVILRESTAPVLQGPPPSAPGHSPEGSRGLQRESTAPAAVLHSRPSNSTMVRESTAPVFVRPSCSLGSESPSQSPPLESDQSLTPKERQPVNADSPVGRAAKVQVLVTALQETDGDNTPLPRLPSMGEAFDDSDRCTCVCFSTDQRARRR